MSKLVCVLSPFRSSEKRHRAVHLVHARMLCLCLAIAGFIPYASHLFAPQFLDDDKPEEREAGIAISKAMIARCDMVWVWDLWGISSGMAAEIAEAQRCGKLILFASLVVSSYDTISPLASPAALAHVDEYKVLATTWGDLMKRAA